MDQLKRLTPEFLLIDLDAAMQTGPKQANIAVQGERLSEGTPHVGDAIVRSHGNMNHERLAEMTNLPAEKAGDNSKCRSVRNRKIWWGCGEGSKLCSLNSNDYSLAKYSEQFLFVCTFPTRAI